MPKRGKSPEGPRENPKSEKKAKKQPEARRAEGRVVDSVFVPFSEKEFLNEYRQKKLVQYGTPQEVQKEFEADRWASHLLLDSLPPESPEGSITGAQFFYQTVAQLQQGDGAARAIVQAFTITAEAFNVPEFSVQMWYATRDYSFEANGLQHPGDWIRHGRR